MKKEHSASLAMHLSGLHTDNPFEEHSLMDWTMRHGKKVLSSILLGFVVLFLLSLWLFRDNFEVAKNYYATLTYFQLFEKSASPEKQQQALLDLQKSLIQYPALQPLYEGKVAQTLLNRNLVEQSLPFANATLKRTQQKDLSDFHRFAHISLLIAEKKYSEALSNSLALKEHLATSLNPHGSNLIVPFNLLRIAFLQQFVGTPHEEIHSWQDFKEYQQRLQQNNQPEQLQALNVINGLFTNGKISLDDYIDMRLKNLADH